MIPTFALPGESAPGQFGPSIVIPLRPDVVVDPQHLVGRDVLGDADHGPDPGVDGLVDRVGGEARRHEDERRVRAGLGDRVARPCRRPGCPSTSWPPLPGRDAGDDVRAVVAVAHGVERALRAGDALDDEPRLVADDDRHQRFLALEDGALEPELAVLDAVGEQLADPVARPRPACRIGRATPRSRSACPRARTSSTSRPASSNMRTPLARRSSSARASGRAAGRLPRRPSPMKRLSDDEHEPAADPGHLLQRRRPGPGSGARRRGRRRRRSSSRRTGSPRRG